MFDDCGIRSSFHVFSFLTIVRCSIALFRSSSVALAKDENLEKHYSDSKSRYAQPSLKFRTAS